MWDDCQGAKALMFISESESTGGPGRHGSGSPPVWQTWQRYCPPGGTVWPAGEAGSEWQTWQRDGGERVDHDGEEEEARGRVGNERENVTVGAVSP